MREHEVRKALTAFVAECRDLEEFYRGTARKVRDTQIRDLLLRLSRLRREAIDDLVPYVESRGAEPPGTGTLKGAAHRALTDLRSAFAGDAEEAWLAELAAAEDASSRRLAKILAKPLPEDLSGLLEQKVKTFESARVQVHALSKAARKD